MDIKMPKTKPLALAIITVLIPVFCVLNQSGCTKSTDVGELSRHLEPLRVRRPDGKVESVTFAQAMAWHHKHEPQQNHSTDAVTSAMPVEPSRPSRRGRDTEHDEGLCVGVAAGYQAIRYAAARLFAGEIPDASDFEMSVAGTMRGVWNVIRLYTGKTPPAVPARSAGMLTNNVSVAPRKMSLASFTFTAGRISTGKTLVFRLRDGLISPEFFALKNRGVICGDPALEALKKQAALKILTIPPEECFGPVP